MTAQMWRYFRVQATDLKSRTTAAQELRLALDALGDDMGSVVWAQPTASGGLLLCRGAPDGMSYSLVEYAVQGKQLVRNDSATGAAVHLADNVSGFNVTRVSPSVLQLDVNVTVDKLTRKARLFWSPPA
jgi:hypothetical protein